MTEEEKKLRELLGNAWSEIDEASKSTYWSYTREFEEGMLEATKIILAQVLETFQEE